MIQPLNIALIVAAGRGRRACPRKSEPAAAAPGDASPKQYAPLAGLPVLGHTLKSFLTHQGINNVAVVIHEEDRALYDACIDKLRAQPLRARDMEKLRPPIIGGQSRAQSVQNGLCALSQVDYDDTSRILVHDAARPLLSHMVIDRVIAAIQPGQGAIAALPVSDTLKKAGSNALITATPPREGMWYAQTPQGFTLKDIDNAYRAAAGRATIDEPLVHFTDDASVAAADGLPMRLVEGARRNIKITYKEDFLIADFYIRQNAMAHEDTNSDAAIEATNNPIWETRTGHGMDVHGFESGDGVTLCGIKIPFDQKLKGHSDADVALHALTDALLGAIGAGDIGDHFPPADPQWRGAASEVFLRHAVTLIDKRGGRIANCDVTLICEEPKIGPYRAEMRANIARILNIDIARVSVKATTTEGLGFTGRKEGIAAMASASVMLRGDEANELAIVTE